MAQGIWAAVKADTLSLQRPDLLGYNRVCRGSGGMLSRLWTVRSQPRPGYQRLFVLRQAAKSVSVCSSVAG